MCLKSDSFDNESEVEKLKLIWKQLLLLWNIIPNSNDELVRCFDGIDAVKSRKVFFDSLRVESADRMVRNFLRARKGNVEACLKMLAADMKWRDKYFVNIVSNLNNGEYQYFKDNSTNGVALNFKSKKAFIIGRDLKKRPVLYVRPKLHNPKDQTEQELEQYSLLTVEETRLFFQDDVSSVTLLFDMPGFSMKNMEYAPFKFLIDVFQNDYPETLGCIIIYKAPFIVKPIWSIVRMWLDPVIVKKVHFIKTFEQLSEFVSADVIPTTLGGNNGTDVDTYVPLDGTLDTDIDTDVSVDDTYVSVDGTLNNKLNNTQLKSVLSTEREDLISKFLEATKDWVLNTSSSNSVDRTKLSQKLTENYYSLDPYIRSRSTYDRDGLLTFNTQTHKKDSTLTH